LAPGLSEFMDKKTAVKALEETAALLELSGANPFKIRAFDNGARILKSSELGLERFYEQAVNKKVKGFGPGLTSALEELLEDGVFGELEDLREQFPDTLLELLKIPGLGAKKVKVLYNEKSIGSLEELEAACKAEEIATLKGFGKKTQDKILQGLDYIKKFRGRNLLSKAMTNAEALLSYLKESKHASKLELAGSLRRKKETIKDIDILAISKEPTELMEHFVQYPLIATVSAHGETKSSIVLEDGIAVDLRVMDEKEFPAALCYFTGSKEFNTKLRGIAQRKELKLNEYGLYKGSKRLKAESEEAILNRLGLSFVPPELREDLGEIELAQKFFESKEKFPTLIELSDIKGILHAHSTYSDGQNTLREMAVATKALGYEYLGITDHSQTASYAGGLKPAQIKKQHEEIDSLNEELAPFKIFKGIESDILNDGSLDYSEKVLASFDFIIASVHSNLSMEEKLMTERICNAVRNPFTTILGHVTGRLLLRREAYAVDVEAVIEAAAETKTAIEINANPYRLDLDWKYHRKAKLLGISLPVNPDAHSIEGLEDVRYGAGVARKGMLENKDVLNTKTRAQLEKYFR